MAGYHASKFKALTVTILVALLVGTPYHSGKGVAVYENLKVRGKKLEDRYLRRKRRFPGWSR
jgi:hypothetical protein